MKRTLCGFLAAAALTGCQSPMSGAKNSLEGFGSVSRTPPEHAVAKAAAPKAGSPKAGSPKAGAPTGMAPTGVVQAGGPQAAMAAGDVQQVGYNVGYGAAMNRSFKQKVAQAVPSHGGEFAGGPGMGMPGMGGPGMGGPGTGGPGMGGPGMGMGGPGMGMPGMGGPGMGGPGMGMGGPGMGMPGMGGPGCAPGMGGMGGPGFPNPLGPRFSTGRSQIRFIQPTGMQIGWQQGAEDFTEPQLQVPARYNFSQARIYRLKLTGIPNRPGLELYPTLEVYPGSVKVDAYLTHNAVPVEFTEEDFDQVQGGNYVTKVIYLPDAKYQELAIAGVETLVSTRLDPGVDPVTEAHRRGTIMAVIRLGSVDLEMPHSPALFPIAAIPPGAPGMGGPPVEMARMMPLPARAPSAASIPTATVVPGPAPKTMNVPPMIAAPMVTGRPIMPTTGPGAVQR
ncbi:MAG: hypothetical protein ACRC1K_09580 [Planctomycetia bacterium]